MSNEAHDGEDPDRARSDRGPQDQNDGAAHEEEGCSWRVNSDPDEEYGYADLEDLQGSEDPAGGGSSAPAPLQDALVSFSSVVSPF